jgi:hypothetical protein
MRRLGRAVNLRIGSLKVLCILVVSTVSAMVMRGSMVGNRFAIIDLPERRAAGSRDPSDRPQVQRDLFLAHTNFSCKLQWQRC